MQRKLKAVFRSHIRKRSDSTEGDRNSEASSPRSTHDQRQAASFDESRYRRQFESHNAGSQQNGSNRPLSSAYDSRRVVSNGTGPQPVTADHTKARSSEPAHDSIANDYKAYLPVLSPVHDSNVEPHVALGGVKPLTTGQSGGLYEENVADRNIDRDRKSLDASKAKPLPVPPGMCIDESTVLQEAVAAIVMKNYVNGFAVLGAAHEDTARKQPNGGRALGSTIRAVPSNANGEYLGGSNTVTHTVTKTVTNGALVDGSPPHSELHTNGKGQLNNTSSPPRAARGEPQLGLSKQTSHGTGRGEAVAQSSSQSGGERVVPLGVNGQADIENEIKQLLSGVVDLTNTVDEDKSVEWAPAVTHEVVKPHEHEIVQHKIFREIHNYEYYHHIQPVYDIEVLPPRHWIPNPDGQGLMEISADELPSRTGNNRRWKIVQEQEDPSTVSRPAWRTEPQIIEHPTTLTKDGFERKETTIIYPPTLQDMTEYDGLIQPVHFDHKSGKRWLGEITTMHTLRQELGQVADPSLSMKELNGVLPDVPDDSDVPGLSKSPTLKRKPVKGPVHAGLGDFGGREGVAVAL